MTLAMLIAAFETAMFSASWVRRMRIRKRQMLISSDLPPIFSPGIMRLSPVLGFPTQPL